MIAPALSLLAAAALGLSAVGCGEKDEDRGPDIPRIPSGADEVVLEVKTAGGYVPVIYARADFPEIVLFGDGALVTRAPVAVESDPAAVPELEVRRLDDAQLDVVLSAAVDAGLAEPEVDFGMPNVTDLPGTSVVFNTIDGTYENSAYALEIADEDTELTDAQVSARADLRALIADLQDPATLLGTNVPAEPFAPDAYSVFSTRFSGTSDAPTQKWPLENVPLADSDNEERCVVVDGADAAALAKAVEGAGIDDLWKSDDNLVEVAIRPLIVEAENPCAE